MKVEIWSDIMCPFCYIGKRNFEAGLQQFAQRDGIEIEWKSFQLDPEMESGTGKTVDQYLAERKGLSLEKSRMLHSQMTERAKQSGLDYRFDKAIPANSFNAHRLSHLAAKNGLQDAAEEKLFAAYFTGGKNIDDTETLVALGTEIGLKEEDVRSMLASDLYANEVEQDIREAQDLGVNGVPFFVFDRKYAVSGAQPGETFLTVLEKSWAEYKPNSIASVETDAGDACSTDGNCN